MKYTIIRVKCKFLDGAVKTFMYDENNSTSYNICDDIEVFRANFKNTIESHTKSAVLSIMLTYEER